MTKISAPARTLRAFALAIAVGWAAGNIFSSAQAATVQPIAAQAAPAFASDRLSVEVIGSGPDVILIASGFVLRAISGAVLIDVTISEWLIICTSMVALLVGFGAALYAALLWFLEREALAEVIRVAIRRQPPADSA